VIARNEAGGSDFVAARVAQRLGRPREVGREVAVLRMVVVDLAGATAAMEVP